MSPPTSLRAPPFARFEETSMDRPTGMFMSKTPMLSQLMSAMVPYSCDRPEGEAEGSHEGCSAINQPSSSYQALFSSRWGLGRLTPEGKNIHANDRVRPRGPSYERDYEAMGYRLVRKDRDQRKTMAIPDISCRRTPRSLRGIPSAADCMRGRDGFGRSENTTTGESGARRESTAPDR